MKLSDTLTGEKREFEPAGDVVSIYICGVTPYAASHVGHAMSYIVFDVLHRYLEFRGYKVRRVQNFTDIDDKLIARAAQHGSTVEELAGQYIDEYFEDMDALNVRKADEYPRATHEIPKIIEMIAGLIDKGFAYPSNGDVYFRVTKDPSYGKLSHRSVDQMRAGARVEPGVEKDHPMDFALWKGAKPGEPAWDSPWGLGRPGWHIECSAMSLRYLGESIDIHGGGQDLVFPHHENEIAQSEAFTGVVPFARFWLHNGLLLKGDEKMSKSLGNLVSIREALELYSSDAIRLSVLKSHYRGPGYYSDDALAENERALNRFRQALQAPANTGAGIKLDATPYRERFVSAMDEDLNTPQALATLFDMARDINRYGEAGSDIGDAQALFRELSTLIFGLTFKERVVVVGDDKTELISELVERRTALRATKQFAEADGVREELATMGVMLTDAGGTTTWRVD
jgi:cysteinyl-tRNA synthetase